MSRLDAKIRLGTEKGHIQGPLAADVEAAGAAGTAAFAFPFPLSAALEGPAEGVCS